MTSLTRNPAEDSRIVRTLLKASKKRITAPPVALILRPEPGRLSASRPTFQKAAAGTARSFAPVRRGHDANGRRTFVFGYRWTGTVAVATGWCGEAACYQAALAACGSTTQ